MKRRYWFQKPNNTNLEHHEINLDGIFNLPHNEISLIQQHLKKYPIISFLFDSLKLSAMLSKKSFIVIHQSEIKNQIIILLIKNLAPITIKILFILSHNTKNTDLFNLSVYLCCEK
jgi:hypothetical protein